MLLRQAEPVGHADKIGKGPRLHLAHDLASMRLYRYLANSELAANLLVHQARYDQRHNFAFSATEQGIAILDRLFLRRSRDRLAATFESALDSCQEYLIAERLCQELHRTRL